MQHWLDQLVGRVVGQPMLFSAGWGDSALLEELSQPVPSQATPERIDLHVEQTRTRAALTRIDVSFESPAARLLPPGRTRTARLEVWLRSEDVDRSASGPVPVRAGVPLALHLASAGEEGTWRRRLFALPLVRAGIGALILENPFYGARRPPGQTGALLRCFTDQLAMNRATVRESAAILRWFHERGHRRLAVTGYSMGGHMAALTSTRVDWPVAAIPCAAGLSPASVFTEGVLSRSVRWQALAAAAGGVDRARLEVERILQGVARYYATAPKPPVAILVAAKSDAFVLPREVQALADAWPHAELRWVEGGHVSTVLVHQRTMRRAIKDAIERLRV